MAVKNNLGKPKAMSLGTVKYAMKGAKANGNISSQYYMSLQDRLNELIG